MKLRALNRKELLTANAARRATFFAPDSTIMKR